MSSGHLQVTDDTGVRYRLVREIGRGGQGIVYEVEGGLLAAKLLTDPAPSTRDRLRNQLTRVRRLDLDGLDVARPIEVLKEPHLGYVMELLTGMEPLSSLAYVPRGIESPAAWYLAAGGLQRRLRLLARAADALAALHGKGLIYGDPSPQNIFVSAPRDAVEVRLIDADNLRTASPPGAGVMYTPGFGAPELVRARTGASSLTDAHAFAVLGFQALSLAHPLIGDLVAEGPPEVEDAALAGDLPWIDDAADPRNRASVGIARPIVLSRLLADLADRSFGVGLQDPQRRPGVAEWALRLHAASDATLTCPSCGATYYMNATVCPWCDAARPTFVLASFILSDPEAVPEAKKRPPSVATLALSPGETVIVPDRLARGRSGSAGQRPVLAMAFDGTRVSLRALDDSSYRLAPPGGGKSVEVGERSREIDLRGASWRLHLGDASILHRVATFRVEKARQA